MHAIKCEVCGSPDLVKQGDFFVCQSCGCKYTPEQARNLVGVVIDKGRDYQDSYNAGMKALENEDWRSASEFFKMALDAKPSDARAFHRFKFCSDMNYLHSGGGMTRVKNLVNAFSQKFATVLDMYFDVSDSEEKETGICEAIQDFIKLAIELGKMIDKKQNHNNEYGGETEELYHSYLERIDTGFSNARERLLTHFGDQNCEPIRELDKGQEQLHQKLPTWFADEKEIETQQALRLGLSDAYSSTGGSYRPSFFRRFFDGIADFFKYYCWDIENISKVILVASIPVFLILGVLGIRNQASFGLILFHFLIAVSAMIHLAIYITTSISDKDYVISLVNYGIQIGLNHFIIFGSLFGLELVWRIIIGIILKIVCYGVSFYIIEN